MELMAKKSIILFITLLSYTILIPLISYEIKDCISEKKIRQFFNFFIKMLLNIFYILNIYYYFSFKLTFSIVILIVFIKIYHFKMLKKRRKNIKKKIYYYL